MESKEPLKVDMSHLICLRCKIGDTQNWPQSRSIESSEFRFLGGRFKLEFYKQREHYTLYLNKCCFGVVHRRPFRVTVQVDGSLKSGVKELMSREEFKYFDGEIRQLWWRSEEQIRRAVPEFRRALTLIVALEPREDSTCPLFSSDPAFPSDPRDTCLQSLSEDFSQLLLDQSPNPDVEFQCGGQSTLAHAAVVSARSRVIARMLASDMVEGRTRVIKIPDMRPDVFDKFLGYLYTGTLDGLTLELALRLFEAGDQYAVAGLVRRCSEYVPEHLSVEGACEALVVADAHGDAGLVEKVVEYMVKLKVSVKCRAYWPAFCDEHPRLANKVLNRILEKIHY